MSVMRLDGIVEHGPIRLPAHVRLSENTKVYVVVPGVEVEQVVRLSSPQLARPARASDFVMEVGDEEPDAGVWPDTVRSGSRRGKLDCSLHLLERDPLPACAAKPSTREMRRTNANASEGGQLS